MNRVLVVGRSPSVLLAAAGILRAKGYSADVSNQYEKVLDDYDVTALDVLVFGGMVPADTKERLRREISALNPGVTFVQGLAGMPGLIAAQVDEATKPLEAELEYDTTDRTFKLRLDAPAAVTVEAWWGTSFVPPEPKSTSLVIFDGRLGAGDHSIPLPADVPSEASFAGVTADSATRVYTVGPMPAALGTPATAADVQLPAVAQVTTQS
jgi:hypothetical protein